MSTKTIKVAAAASLKNGLETVIAAFKATPAGSSVTFDVTYNGSYTLANQIVNNTVLYDIYLAASDENDPDGMKKVVNAAKTISTPVLFIANDLVLIRNSKGTFSGVISFGTVNSTTVGSGQHIWIANIEKAPAGKYAKAAFDLTTPSSWTYLYGKAATDKTIGDDVQKTLAGVVNDNDINNIQALGVVYNSDYLNSPSAPGTKTFLVNYAPATINGTINYSAAVLTNATSSIHNVETEATAFVTFLVNNPSILQAKDFRLLSSPPKNEL
ncbi:MAG: substrate-binding domain-containing protein [Nitrososphaerota archaeon]|jgi:molybdenum ABC transporter molybdate-binding protein|nr:substrate-binding domain-containing protein [Nitrososphaerota archaeon]